MFYMEQSIDVGTDALNFRLCMNDFRYIPLVYNRGLKLRN